VVHLLSSIEFVAFAKMRRPSSQSSTPTMRVARANQFDGMFFDTSDDDSFDDAESLDLSEPPAPAAPSISAQSSLPRVVSAIGTLLWVFVLPLAGALALLTARGRRHGRAACGVFNFV
jgi:hypothetical protein